MISAPLERNVTHCITFLWLLTKSGCFIFSVDETLTCFQTSQQRTLEDYIINRWINSMAVSTGQVFCPIQVSFPFLRTKLNSKLMWHPLMPMERGCVSSCFPIPIRSWHIFSATWDGHMQLQNGPRFFSPQTCCEEPKKSFVFKFSLWGIQKV